MKMYENMTIKELEDSNHMVLVLNPQELQGVEPQFLSSFVRKNALDAIQFLIQEMNYSKNEAFFVDTDPLNSEE